MKMSKNLRALFILLAITLVTFQPLKAQQASDNYFEISKNLEVFASLFKELNESYVDPIEPGKAMKTGIDAMLAELDPYTNYITEDDIQNYRFQTTGSYGGIGSTVIQKDGFVAIDEPYENSPTQKAGLKAGDLIIAIDGNSTAGKSVSDVSDFLKGSPGTKVKLTIKDAFTKAESIKTITRGQIKVTSVPFAGFVGENKNIAYARLTQFTQKCSNLLLKNLDSLKKVKPNMKGIVLDLRGNPGGLLDESVNICNLFVGKNQLVVSTKGKAKDWDKDFRTSRPAWDENIPVTILINNRSASASEIVSGTLQDLDRGVVIGQKSFGKGLVQTTKSLSYNSKLKVTTAKYYTPSGRCIQAIDYSNRKEDGSLGKIADSLKTKFKTKNGRTVFDGGGVEPDVKVEREKAGPIIPTLFRKYYIFDYAIEYVKKHPSIASASQFELTDADFEDFRTWLKGKDYSYKTNAEKALEKFKKAAEKEQYFASVKSDYEGLKNALSHDKEQDLVKNKKQIKMSLQNEIVSRYYYQRGKFENGLIDDKELAKAVEILNDTQAYNKLLSGK